MRSGPRQARTIASARAVFRGTRVRTPRENRSAATSARRLQIGSASNTACRVVLPAFEAFADDADLAVREGAGQCDADVVGRPRRESHRRQQARRALAETVDGRPRRQRRAGIGEQRPARDRQRIGGESVAK
jgi:hypothetical protein